MWNCVPVGMAQTKQVVRARVQGIAVSTFKPDPGELRRVLATSHARACVSHQASYQSSLARRAARPTAPATSASTTKEPRSDVTCATPPTSAGPISNPK